jgi:putative SOS response-associated peptidase YedK
MPIILARELEDAWLDPTYTDKSQILDLLSTNPGVNLEAYQISILVNTPRNDAPELITRGTEYQGLLSYPSLLLAME